MYCSLFFELTTGIRPVHLMCRIYAWDNTSMDYEKVLVVEADVILAISKLRNIKSTAHDQINLQYIKESLMVTIPYIRLIMNTSIVAKVFPYSHYPDWPHMQCVGLAFRRSHVRGSLSAASLVICCRHCTVQNMELRGYCPVCDQSIWSSVSDAIVSSWLWSTATRSSPLGYFSKLPQVVNNWTHILW